MGEKIAFGSDTELMHKAADELEALLEKVGRYEKALETIRGQANG
jgi:hypothetical protein